MNNAHNTVRKPDNLHMRHRGQPLHSKRRKDWLPPVRPTPLVHLPLMARKSELGERVLIGHGHGRWSGHGRDYGHVLDSGSDSDLDSDLDPGHSA